MYRQLLGLACAVTALLSVAAEAQDAVPLDFRQAQWIWAGQDAAHGDMVAFRRGLELAAQPVFGRLWVTADTAYQLLVNGNVIGEADGWADPEQYDLTAALRPGANVVAIRVVGGRHPGLLAAARVVDADGRLVDLVSDSGWKVTRQLPEGWAMPGFDASGWPDATPLAPYGSGPWGRLTGMTVDEAQRAYDDLAFGVPDESGAHPASVFRGEYAAADLAARYRDYLGVDRVSGRFTGPSGSAPRLFVRYRQAGGVSDPLRFDWTRYEADLALVAELGFDLALEGFSWTSLLDAEGRWARVSGQPSGLGLPNFDYAYQVLDYALDRAEAHGLHVMALVDLGSPLPEALLPAEHRDMLLVADSLWDGMLRGVAKIAGRYAGRPVVAGWVVGPDGLPAFPTAEKPVVRQLWESQLRRSYGDITGLRRAWGVGPGLVNLDGVAIPRGPEDPGASDLRALDAWLVSRRLASLAEALRAADPHHLLVAAVGDPRRPVPAAELPFDLLAAGTVRGGELRGLDGIPSYGECLAAVRAALRVPETSVAGLLGGVFGSGQRGAFAARTLRHEWADTVGTGGAGVISAVSLDDLTGGGLPGMEQRAGLNSLAALVAQSDSVFAAAADTVLVIRDSKLAAGLGAGAEAAGVRRVIAALGRADVAATVVWPEALAMGGAPLRVDLARYRAVVLPTVAPHTDGALLGLLNEWLATAPNRLLMLGAWGVPGAAMPAGLDALTGGMSLHAGPLSVARSLSIGPPLTTLPIGRQVVVPASVPLASLLVPSTAELQVAGRVDGAAVVAVREVSGSRVMISGFPLGLAGLTDDAADLGDQLLAATVGAAVRQAGLGAAWQTAANVAAYPGSSVALVRETGGASSEVAWRGPASQPPLAYGDATTRFEADGSVEVDAAIGPYQVRVLEVAGEVVGWGAGQSAVVRATGGGPGRMLTFSGEGPQGLGLRMAVDPERPVNLIRPGSGASTVPAGSPTVTVPLDGQMIQVVYGIPAPQAGAAVSDPETFMAVGDYYVSKGDFGRAMREFERLSQLYPGSGVATAATARRQKLLAESGAVVLVNYSRQPVAVRYQGPSTTDAAVPPGQSRTVILYAGDYQEVQQTTGPQWTVAPLTESRTFSVAKGEATVREWGVAGGGSALDPKLNVRGRLTTAEQEALLAQAKGELPRPPAAAGAAGGEAGPTTQLTGPELPIIVETEQKALAEQKIPPEIAVQNKTKETIELTLVFFSVGVRPRTEVFTVRPRGRVRLEMKDTGTYQMEGVILSNNQPLTFGQFSPDAMTENAVVIREMTNRELQAQAEEAQRRAEQP